MAKPLFVISFSLFLLLPLYASYPNPNSSTSPSPAHTELTNHGIPIGLPCYILTYTLNRTSGDFSVHLAGMCKVTLPRDNYLANKITGKIVEGRIAELDGIRVRAFFKWWSITGIKSKGEDLVFEVSMVTACYPSKNFDESPPCEGKRYAD